MANEYRKDGNIISWTNNLTAGTGTVAKGSLVHIGNNKFGVAVDAIAFGASGELIVRGSFTGGSAIINETVKVGNTLLNSSADIMVVTTLKTATAALTGDFSNLYLTKDVTASSSAQSFEYKLTG
jgi:predicted RecA/RadA family phage recombinase